MSGGVGGIGGPGRVGPSFEPEAPDATRVAPEAPAARSFASGPTSAAWALRAGIGHAAAAGRSASLPIVGSGSQGAAVRELQERLNGFRANLGLRQLPVTSTFGPQTRDAVVQFQKLWGLDADGAVGPKTWARVLGEPGPAAVSATPARGTAEAQVLAHAGAILEASRKHGIPPSIICGMIEKESSGHSDAIGPTGDKGLLQINERSHPAFFRSRDWRDVHANVDYGVSHFKANLKSFSGDVDKALAAYNAGVGGVRQGLRNGKTLDEITFKPRYVSGIEGFARKYAAFF